MAAPKFAEEGLVRVLSSLENEELRVAHSQRSERMSIESTTELADLSTERQALMAEKLAPASRGLEVDEVVETGFCSSCCSVLLVILSVVFIIGFFPFSLFFVIKVVPQYERAIIFRLGRIKEGKEQGPGMFFILPCIDKFISVDLRTKTFDVPPQRILTKDSVTVNVDAVVYFHIFDSVMSIKNITDANRATRLLAQTTLRNILGAHTLAEILSSKDHIQREMTETLDQATDNWGVKVTNVELKDVRLPREMQRAMAAEAEASREAKAKIISAEGELNASRALKEAADVIHASPTALQLRYLQTLNIIGAERGTTIMFPVPMDIMGPAGEAMMGGGRGGGGGLAQPPFVQVQVQPQE